MVMEEAVMDHSAVLCQFGLGNMVKFLNCQIHLSQSLL